MKARHSPGFGRESSHFIVSRSFSRDVSLSPHQRGLSLIEVAIVFTMISMMMLLSLPMLSSANARARSELCQQNLVEMGQAVVHYARDTNCLPTLYNGPSQDVGMSLAEFIKPRVQTPNALFCPSDETAESQSLGTSYTWGTAFNNQTPGGIHQLLGKTMLADRETYHTNSQRPINEVAITEDNNDYLLSLLAIDPESKAGYSKPILVLMNKQADQSDDHHSDQGQ